MSKESQNGLIPEQPFNLSFHREKEMKDSVYTIEEVKKHFLKRTLAYEELRQDLHRIESVIVEQKNTTIENAERRAEILTKITSLKEEFLPLIARSEELLGQSQTIETIKSWMIESAGGKIYLNDWTNFGKHMRAVSLEILYSATVSMLQEEGPKRTTSPYEAILSSIELREIGRDTAELIKDHAVSICQSGSASWGAYTSTRGQIKPDPLELSQRELRDMKLISDVDMVVIIDSPDDIKKIVKILVDEGRVDNSELRRVDKYVELSKKGDVDMFSMRGYFNNIEQSYHFLQRDVIGGITDPTRIPKNEIPSLRDFRPDMPGSLRKYGGYPILGLEGSQIALLEREPTVADENNESLGFISESPAGGPIQIKIDGEIKNHFALGLIPTQLMYMPDVLHDTSGFFRGQIDRMFKSIAPYLPKETEFSVPRWERMPTSFKRKMLEKIYPKNK